MAFNHSKLVVEEEEAEVGGTCQIWFLLFFFCFSVVFVIVFPCWVLMSFLDFRMLVTFVCGDAGAPYTKNT